MDCRPLRVTSAATIDGGPRQVIRAGASLRLVTASDGWPPARCGLSELAAARVNRAAASCAGCTSDSGRSE